MLKTLFNGWTKDGFLKLSDTTKQTSLDRNNFYRIYRAVTEANLKPEKDQWVMFSDEDLNLPIEDFWLKLYEKDYGAVARYVRDQITSDALRYTLLADCILIDAYTPTAEDDSRLGTLATDDKYKKAAACDRKAIALGEAMAIYKLARLALTKKHTLTQQDFDVCALPFDSAATLEQQVATLLVFAGQKGIAIAINDLGSFLVHPGKCELTLRDFLKLGLGHAPLSDTRYEQVARLSATAVQKGESMGLNTLSVLWLSDYTYTLSDFNALGMVKEFNVAEPMVSNVTNASALCRASWQQGLPTGLVSFATTSMLGEALAVGTSLNNVNVVLEEAAKIFPENRGLLNLRILLTMVEIETAPEQIQTTLAAMNVEFPEDIIISGINQIIAMAPADINLALKQFITQISQTLFQKFSLDDPNKLVLLDQKVKARLGLKSPCNLSDSDCEFLGISKPNGSSEENSALLCRAFLIGNGLVKLLALKQIQGVEKLTDTSKHQQELRLLCEIYFRLSLCGREYYLNDISLVHLTEELAALIASLLPEQASCWPNFESNYLKLIDQRSFLRDFILPSLLNLSADQAPEVLNFFRKREHKLELVEVIRRNPELFAKHSEKLVDNDCALGQIINFDPNLEEVVEPNQTKASKTLVTEFRIPGYDIPNVRSFLDRSSTPQVPSRLPEQVVSQESKTESDDDDAVEMGDVSQWKALKSNNKR